ncbi:Ankyrin-repeat domain containing transcription coregulator asaA [Colletotrichum siamense]|nr:Ankyrin-repeat domain containing transcription coregulator asaA [Colletotrichum siamense]
MLSSAPKLPWEERQRRRTLSHEEQDRLAQEDRHRPDSTYPPKLHFKDKFHRGGSSASELVQKAIEDRRLNPNTLWTYEDIIDPHPTSAPNEYGDTWQRWNTPLHLALLCFDYESAKILLRHDGDPNIYNAEGRTAIHEAIKLHNIEAIRFFIHHGADPNKASQDGLVPLHAALYEGYEEVFFALLENGATLEAATQYEWSITDLALLASEDSILERLMSDEYGQLPSPLMLPSRAAPRSKPQDIAIPAKRLLAVVSSKQVLPERTLYDTYHHLVSVSHIPRNQKWDTDAVNALVDNVMDSLHSVSQIPRLALGEKFCLECLRFLAYIKTFCRDTAAANREYSGNRVDLHKNKQELDDCALSGCPICLAISGELRNLNEKGNSGQSHELIPVSLKIWRSSPIFIEGKIGPYQISDFTAHVGDSKSPCASFGLRPYDTGFETHQGYPLSQCNDHSTGSPKAMSVAKHWLQICKTSPGHSVCRDTYGPRGTCSTLPTRVLNVGSEDREPFLFEGHGLKERYCILSYCWGLSGNATTTKNNFSHRKQGIPLESLPTLLRQAVIVARSLGYKYLWIDALCIIQDDADDWAREAAVMHELYSRADLALTSLVAADSRDSLFVSRSRETARPIPLKIGLPKKYRHTFNEGVFEFAAYPSQHHHKDEGFEGPVHQRAWTLQEYLMSTRVLYFGPGILHWDCLYSYHIETNPEARCYIAKLSSRHSRDLDTRRRLRRAVKTFQQQGLSHNDIASPIEVWQSQVEEFTQRKLTKQSDRIPAFLAISKVLCKAGGDEFAGGLWTGKHLIPSMCWRLEQAEEANIRGPSWTWGSRSGAVSYDLCRHPGKMIPVSSVILVDISPDRSHSNISGSITLRGSLRVWRSDNNRPNIPSLRSDPIFGSGTSEWFDQTPDSQDSLYIFDMLKSGRTPPPPPSPIALYGPATSSTVSLLLRAVDGKDFSTALVFRRVGIANKTRIEGYSVSEKAGYDVIARNRGITEFENNRVVVIV